MSFRDSYNFLRGSQPVALRETILPGSGGGYDPDETLSASQGGSTYFRRLSQARRDLNPLTQERAIELAFWLYDSNPLAKAILETKRDYVLGEGVTVTVEGVNDRETQALQQVVDLFWQENHLDRKLPHKVLELGLFGEAIYTAAVNPKDGMVYLGTVDPAQLGDVIMDPADGETPLAIALKRQINSNMADRRLKVINRQMDPARPWYGRLVGAEVDDSGKPVEQYAEDDTTTQMDDSAEPIEPMPPGPVANEMQAASAHRAYVGSCLFFTVNKVANAKRGRSDLLSLIDWVDGFDQLMFNRLDRSLLMNAFVWDVEYQGADQKEIDEYRQNIQAGPKPGTVNVHNERIDWKAVNPSMQAHDAQQDAAILLSHIANGARLPKTWIGAVMDVNLATARAIAEPTEKALTMRQKEVKYLIEHLVRFALDQAEIAGRIRKRKTLAGTMLPQPWNVTVTMPDIQARDIAQAGQTLQQVAAALAILLTERVVDVEAAQEIVRIVAGQIGYEIDLVSLRDRLEKIEAKTPQDPAAQQVADTLALGSGKAKALQLDPDAMAAEEYAADEEQAVRGWAA